MKHPSQTQTESQSWKLIAEAYEEKLKGQPNYISRFGLCSAIYHITEGGFNPYDKMYESLKSCADVFDFAMGSYFWPTNRAGDMARAQTARMLADGFSKEKLLAIDQEYKNQVDNQQ